MYRLKKQILEICILLILTLSFLVANNCFGANLKYIRVLIFKDVSSLNVRIDGFYEVRDIKHQTLYRGKNLSATITVSRGKISMGKAIFNNDRLIIRADDPQVVMVNGKKFRGDICLVRSNSLLKAVNYIELEDYVKGVLIHEASHYWPLEALKALAVVCRSFALYQAEERSSQDYDLSSDIYSQVYGGKSGERYRLNQAVDSTKSQVLVYKGKVLPAFHHATCGGATEDAAILWNIDILPLKGVVCGFCQDSPHFNWHLVLNRAEVRKKLSDGGYKTQDIQDIVILSKTNSGRVKDMSIVFASGNLNISAKDFRNTIGPNSIRSANFKLRFEGEDIVFEGIGWGHGVGFCQWGAYFMAKEDYNFHQILEHYYPGSKIEIRS
ncbi:MAG: SpoIID/LytB domain-containing protein [Candidatus Omnitrophota bacterium]|nr:SpoIID/LytB domain-containing protein [Candidatus Omnitrophota bacterium]